MVATYIFPNYIDIKKFVNSIRTYHLFFKTLQCHLFLHYTCILLDF